jgi:lysophospholipase L1-like esterase
MIWYEEEVKHLEQKRQSGEASSGTIVFYGSSSIRLWETLSSDFPHIQSPVNLGFGGSTLAACTWFFDRLVVPYQPKSLVVYAGDNDLGDGRHPEEIYQFFFTLLQKVKHSLGPIRFSFISIKPSPCRWASAGQIQYTNELIRNEIAPYETYRYIDVFTPMLDTNGNPRRELFVEDGLHLSKAGYEVWRQALQSQADQIF